MQQKVKVLFFALIFFIPFFDVVAQSSSMQTWQQFRGNERQARFTESGILEKWPAAGPEMLWKKNIGTSFSELLFADNKIYTLCSHKKDSVSGDEYAIAFNAITGAEIWKSKLDSIFIDVDGWGDGSRSTPALDGKNMYCLTSYGKLIAVSFAGWQNTMDSRFCESLSKSGTPLGILHLPSFGGWRTHCGSGR
jgi:hypothetical protein